MPELRKRLTRQAAEAYFHLPLNKAIEEIGYTEEQLLKVIKSQHWPYDNIATFIGSTTRPGLLQQIAGVICRLGLDYDGTNDDELTRLLHLCNDILPMLCSYFELCIKKLTPIPKEENNKITQIIKDYLDQAKPIEHITGKRSTRITQPPAVKKRRTANKTIPVAFAAMTVEENLNYYNDFQKKLSKILKKSQNTFSQKESFVKSVHAFLKQHIKTLDTEILNTYWLNLQLISTIQEQQALQTNAPTKNIGQEISHNTTENTSSYTNLTTHTTKTISIKNAYDWDNSAASTLGLSILLLSINDSEKFHHIINSFFLAANKTKCIEESTNTVPITHRRAEEMRHCLIKKMSELAYNPDVWAQFDALIVLGDLINDAMETLWDTLSIPKNTMNIDKHQLFFKTLSEKMDIRLNIFDVNLKTHSIYGNDNTTPICHISDNSGLYQASIPADTYKKIIQCGANDKQSYKKVTTHLNRLDKDNKEITPLITGLSSPASSQVIPVRDVHNLWLTEAKEVTIECTRQDANKTPQTYEMGMTFS